MREIKFRGYHEIAGWVIGSYRTNYDDHHAIADCKCQIEYAVKKESIGQYIGIKLNDGTELCSGDILQAEGDAFYGLVFYDDGEARFTIDIYKDGRRVMRSGSVKSFIIQRKIANLGGECSVIANSFENPELLGESNE